MMTTRVALVPAYVPTSSLPSILEEARSRDFRLVVVDDGSGDGSRDVFEAAARYGTVLRHPFNQGKGQAIKTGLRHIRAHCPSDCVVVTMDADGQHTVSDAVRLCEASQRHPGSLILGSRGLRGDVPLRSRVGNVVTRLVYHVSTGRRVWDTQTGLRAFHAGLIPALLSVPGDRYEYEMNVLLAFSRSRAPASPSRRSRSRRSTSTATRPPTSTP